MLKADSARVLSGTLRLLVATIIVQLLNGQGLNSLANILSTLVRCLNVAFMFIGIACGRSILILLVVASMQCLTRSIVRQGVTGRVRMQC